MGREYLPTLGEKYIATFQGKWLGKYSRPMDPLGIQKSRHFPSSRVCFWLVGEANQRRFLRVRTRNVPLKKDLPGTPWPTIYKWLFQLDDSKSLHRKWLFHQTSIYKWLFGVPGGYVRILF